MRRRSYLLEFEILLIVALVVCGVGALAGGWQLATRAAITVAVDGAPALPGLVPGAHPDPDGQVPVVVDEPSGTQVAWEAARLVPWFVLVVFTLVMLLLVVRAARRGEPFAAANIRRLALTGWVLLVGSAVAFVVEFIAVTELATTVTTADSVSASATYPFVWVFSSLGFLAMSEVLKRGRALQTELAEVI